MALNSDALKSAARAGKLTLFYETDAQMVADTAPISEGEYVRVGELQFIGAASDATDHDRTNAGGAKLYVVPDPFVFPEHFGASSVYNASTDDTSFVQAALSRPNTPVFLRRHYRVTNVFIPRAAGTKVIQGMGSQSGLVGTSTTPDAVLETYDKTDVSAALQNGPILRDFCVSPGVNLVKRAIAFSKIKGGSAQNLGTHGYGDLSGGGHVTFFAYVFDYEQYAFEMVQNFSVCKLFSSTPPNTAGRAHFRVNSGVSNCDFDNLYVAASGQYHLDIDGTRIEFDHGISELPTKGNKFYRTTFQGATKYSIKIKNCSTTSIDNHYAEGSKTEFLVLGGSKNIEFNTCSFNGAGSGKTHQAWIEDDGGGIGQITFRQGFIFQTYPIIVGKMDGPLVLFHNFHSDGILAPDNLETIPAALSFDAATPFVTGTPIFGHEQAHNGSNFTRLFMKTANTNYAAIYVNFAGSILVETPAALTVTAISRN